MVNDYFVFTALTQNRNLMPDKSFVVISDTKEKMPWNLYDSRILEQRFEHIKTGDYTVEGLEDLLCIERKRNVTEIAQNVNQKRFHAELERMRGFRWKYLILEASMSDVLQYPLGENLPKKVLEKVRMNGKYIIKCLTRMTVKYGLNIIYACNRNDAQLAAVNIMKGAVDLIDEESQT